MRIRLAIVVPKLPPRMDPSPNLAPASVDPPLWTHDIVQRESSGSAGISGAGTGTIRHPIPGDTSAGIELEAMTLQYYQELDISADDRAELFFYDMDLARSLDSALLCLSFVQSR